MDGNFSTLLLNSLERLNNGQAESAKELSAVCQELKGQRRQIDALFQAVADGPDALTERVTRMEEHCRMMHTGRPAAPVGRKINAALVGLIVAAAGALVALADWLRG